MPLIENPDEIQLRSDEVQEILGDPPKWILRWGITVIFLCVLAFLAISYLVKYPDIVPTMVILTTENPPVRVVSRGQGKMDKLLVVDKEAVEKDQALAILNNPTNYEDLLTLERALVSFQKMGEEELKNATLPKDIVLGELQPTYSGFVNDFEDFVFFSKENNLAEQRKYLENQVAGYRNLSKNLAKQKTILQKELLLVESDYERNVELLKEGAISKVDVESSESRLLQMRRQIESFTSNIINNKLRVDEIKSQISRLKQGGKEDKTFKYRKVVESLKQLAVHVNSWKESYIITAPITGKVSLSKYWSENQFVAANSEVMTIVPLENRGNIIGKATLPIANSGKVEVGHRVNIKLDGFPYREFGMVSGMVKSMALVPNENGYNLEIELKNGLKTNYKKELDFIQEMQGRADIITEERRLIERVFDQLLSIINESRG